MKSKESGFSTAFALTVIFSLCVITLSFAMIVNANEKKICSYKKAFDARKNANKILFNIEEKLQELKDYPSDIDECQILSLISMECDYEITVKDVSTGINENFVSSEILEDESVRRYMTLNEEVALTEYGWINPRFADKTVLDEISLDFENKNAFPLINNTPPLNIHFMTDDFIMAVLEYFKIKNGEHKIEQIREKLNCETSSKELAKILGISESHAFFDLIGFKTLFWKISFETDKCVCSAVFAAVPQKDNQKKIDRYILVEKDIVHKGGSL